VDDDAQLDLFGELYVPVQDPAVEDADLPRLRGHNLIVLHRLRHGSATNVELADLLGPASAWRTRVSDVRRWLESTGDLTVRAERVEGGLWRYSIARKGG
jgi:hypothetical protein